MKHLKLFFACLLMAVLSIGQVWGATYFEDTFSNVGNSDNQSISSRSGWGSFSKCYSQGNSGLRIGSSSAAGSVTKTAMTNISGTKDIKVTVYTAKYNTNANSFTVSVANGTISEVTGVGTLSAGKITISPSNNAGVTSTTSAATWTDAYKTVFTITGASSSTTITFASNKRVILGPVKIEDATSSDPSVEVAPSSLAFGSVEQNTSVAAKTFSVSGSNLTGAITISAPAGYTVSPTSITPSTGSIAATDVTVTPITSSIGTFNGDVTISGGGLSSNVTVGLTMTVTAPFDGEVLEIKNTDFATSYASANGDHEFGCITITSNQVGNYTSSIQFQKNTGYIYNKTSLGEIAKIEITKTGNNNLVVYEGTEENPTTSSITGVAVDNITTYTFSSGKSYFRIFCNNTGASNVTPIKVYYHPASYEVTLSAGSNGSLSATVDAAAIASGDDVKMCKTVTITATPDEGYKIKSLTVTDEDDDEVEVTSNQFVMPAKAVTVAATFEATKALSSISLSGTHRTAFWQGESFSSEGLIVTAHYEGADDEVVTPASISSPDMSTPGEKTITVTYTEGTTKSNTYTINVKALPTTQGTAGTVADLIDIYDKLGNQSNLYIKGTIYKINGFYSEKYISYWITDSYDGEANPNHSNEFELYNGLDFDGADFTAATDLEVGQYVIVKGNLTKFSSTYEFATGNEIVSRPKVLKGIALSGTYPTEFTQGDEFSSEGLVVTASYNYGDPVAVIPTSITGYNMATTGNQTVTVSYTEGGVTKTATYGISVAAPDLCEHKATISKGAEVNGTFSLSVSGEQCLDELPGNVISTILTAEPAEHYHLASVTATVGTVGAIANNECTISDINASTTITAVFEEDDKVTVKFAMGTENATGDVPADVADQYAGQSVTLPANPFTYTGSPIKVFGGWKHSLTNEVKQPGSYTITAADAAEDNITFTAVWNDLSPWATVYSSNVTLSSDQNVQVTIGTGEGANKAGVKANKGSSATFTIPAGTTHLYAHMAAWNGEGQSVTVSGDCFDENKAISIIADANVSGSGTTFDIDDAKAPLDYFKEIVLDKEVTEPTEITITAASGKRFVLFGVNAVYPAAITLDPTSKNFGEVKENANAEFEFTITPNAMSTGDLVASIIGTDAAKFSASAISENKVTVTFTPGEVGGPYSASLKIESDNAEVTADLSGIGITSATPEIGIDKTEVAFGNVEQNTTPATQSVAVTLSNIDEDGVSAAITGSVFSLSTNKLTENGSIVITPVTTTPGTYSETLTLSATGATSKNVTVTMTVVDEWAYVYTSNVTIASNTAAHVTINEVDYEAAKTSKGASATITLPQGVTKIHMHIVAWKDEAQTVTVSGDCFDEDKEITIIANDDVSGSGTTYPLGASGVAYYCSLTPDKAVSANEVITISAASGVRFVLFGVNQEGGVVPELDHITITGELANKDYELGDELDKTGLTVTAYYTLAGAAHHDEDVTSDVVWSNDPLTGGQTSVDVTATYGGKSDTKACAINAVVVPTPEIILSESALEFSGKQYGAVANKTFNVTLKNVAAATVALSGDDATKFSIDPAALTANGTVTVSVANTNVAGSFSATITVSDDAAAAAAQTVALTLTITADEAPASTTAEWIEATEIYDGMPVLITGVNTTTSKIYAMGAQNDNNRAAVEATLNGDVLIPGNGTKAFTLVKQDDDTYAIMTSDGKYLYAASSSKNYLRTQTDVDADAKWTITVTSASAEGSSNRHVMQFNTSGLFSCYESASQAPIKLYTPKTYTRNVSGNYGTICLPKAGVMTNGVLYEISYYDADQKKIFFDEVEGGVMVAGAPYIFKPNENVTELKVAYTDVAVVNNAGHKNGLYGHYDLNNPTEGAEAARLFLTNGDYFLRNNEYWLVDQENRVYVDNYRAYIKLDKIGNDVPPQAYGRRRVAMNVNGEQVATGFENLNASEKPVKLMIDGNIYILRGEKLYDTTGRLVK